MQKNLDGVELKGCSNLDCCNCAMHGRTDSIYQSACINLLMAEVNRLREKIAGMQDVWNDVPPEICEVTVISGNPHYSWADWGTYKRTPAKTIEQEIAEKIRNEIRIDPNTEAEDIEIITRYLNEFKERTK